MPMVGIVQRHRTLAVGFTAQVLQYGSALALVPFMVTRLPAAEVGIWYVFMGVQTLAFICDFGFQPTFTRAFALAFAGRDRLVAQGLGDPGAAATGPNLKLAGEVLRAAKIFYRLLALAILLPLLGIGFPYITHLAHAGGVPIGTAQIAWAIFALSVCLNLAVQWIGPALMGEGRVEANYLFIIANRGTFALLGIIVLLMGGGLIGLAGALIGAQLIALAWVSVRGVGGKARQSAPPSRSAVHDVLKTIWPNASRMGLVAIGGFLITRYNLFAISSFNGLEIAGSYALSLQMLVAIMGVAQLPMQISIPKLVAARVDDDRSGLRRMYLSAMALYLTIFVLGAVVVVLVIPAALAFIGSNVPLLPTAILLLLTSVALLEGLHSNAAFFITSGNDVPFVRAALLSGICVAASTSLTGWLGGGVAAMIACQGLVQLAYNNWRWPLAAWREVREP